MLKSGFAVTFPFLQASIILNGAIKEEAEFQSSNQSGTEQSLN